MISSNDFRTGTTIELDGAVWRVVEFLHVKPGKGSAFVRTKLKGVQSGNVVEKTFRAGEMVQQALLEKSTLQPQCALLYKNDTRDLRSIACLSIVNFLSSIVFWIEFEVVKIFLETLQYK